MAMDEHSKLYCAADEINMTVVCQHAFVNEALWEPSLEAAAVKI